MMGFIPIIAALIGAGSAIGTMFLREWWVNKFTTQKNKATTLWMVRIFLLRELEENFKEYNKHIINLTHLKDVLESDWETLGTDTPPTLYKQHSMTNYRFQISEWERQKVEIVKIDFELAKRLADVYRRFELLKSYSDKNQSLSDVKVKDFKGFTNDYNSLIKNIDRIQ